MDTVQQQERHTVVSRLRRDTETGLAELEQSTANLIAALAESIAGKLVDEREARKSEEEALRHLIQQRFEHAVTHALTLHNVWLGVEERQRQQQATLWGRLRLVLLGR